MTEKVHIAEIRVEAQGNDSTQGQPIMMGEPDLEGLCQGPHFVSFQRSPSTMHENVRPAFTRGFSSHHTPETPTESTTPTPQTPAPRQPKAMHVKRVTLTSKKNWWMGALATSLGLRS